MGMGACRLLPARTFIPFSLGQLVSELLRMCGRMETTTRRRLPLVNKLAASRFDGLALAALKASYLLVLRQQVKGWIPSQIASKVRTDIQSAHCGAAAPA